MVIAGEKSLERPLPSWRYLSAALALLAVREWLGVLGLSDPSFVSWYPVAAIMQTLAGILTLFAARAESPKGSLRAKVGYFVIALLLLTLMATLIAPYFRYAPLTRDGHTLIDATRFFLVKGSMWVVSLFLLYCTLRSPERPSRPVIIILGVFCLHAFLIFICRPPGLPLIPGTVEPMHTYTNTVLFLLRIVTATILAILMWNFYSRSVGVTTQIRWWPLVLPLFIVAIAAGFIVFSQKSYERIVKHNIAASAMNAAAVIDPAALLAAAADRGSANDPVVGNRVFAKARALAFYQGFARLRMRIDALAAPAGEGEPPIPVVDVTSDFDGGHWAVKYAGAHDARTVFADHPVFSGGNLDRFEPMMATAPVRDPAGNIVGAAILTVSASDAALDMYMYKRPILLFLPVAFSILLLLVSGQQRSWLSSHSTSRADAIRQGILGNELTGVMITRGDTIIDCNQRLLDIVGMSRDGLLGADTTKIFDTLSEESMTVEGLVSRPTAEMSRVSIRRPDGRVAHLLAYGRPLTDNPGDNHYIWESVDVTAQKDMENRLRENHDNMQMILDTMPDAVFLKDERGRIRLANQSFCDFMGLPRGADVLGKTVREIAPDIAEVSEENDGNCRDMAGITLVYEQSCNHGDNIKHFEITKTLARQADGDVIIGTMHDLTQHKADQDALRQERHFLLQLLNTLPMSVCFIDRDEVIRLCDQDFSREAGYEDPEELVGRRYADIAPYGPVYLTEDAKMMERGHGFSDTDFELTRDGVTRNFKVRRIVMSNSDGTLLGLVKAFWDTTNLVAANHAAKKADRAKAAFLANMSHELRTPMNGIVGMADLIIDHDSTQPVQRLYAETIIKSARTLQMVIDEVMDIATVDDASRRLALSSAPFPLLTLTEEAAQIVSCIIEAWGVGLHLSYDFTLHSIYHGDARHVRQVLVQVLTHCSRLASDRRLRLEVCGAGRDRVAFRTIFSPPPEVGPDEIAELFRHPDEQMQKNARSSGSLGIFDERIGLPLLWRLIDAMDGSLEVKNGIGAVTCEIVLPLRRDLPGASPPLMAPDLSGMRILVATADPLRFTAAKACLEYARAQVFRASDLNGTRQLAEQAMAAGEPYHMIALDTELGADKVMPGFILGLRDSGKTANPPIMLIVSSRQVQNLVVLSDNIKTLLLPPVLPSELWYKAEMIFTGESGAPSPAGPPGPSKGTTTVVVKRASTRITRMVKVSARVLLVEDNTVNQMVVMGILKRIGCDAVLAKNGLEAVELIEGGETFDLVFMDCMMPVMDGYEATSRIRMHERANTGTARNTIIALTANSVVGDKEKCLASGMDGYITKPVTLELLRDAMTRYCPDLVRMVDQAEEA